MAGRKGIWIMILIIAIVLLIGVNLFSFGGIGITGNVASDADGVVRLGWMGPLSGDKAIYGENIKRGVEMALKELDLTNIEITFEDSKCDEKEAVSVLNKLISVDNVEAVIGEVCSKATLEAAPIAETNQVVLISPSSASPEITNAGDYVFRTVPSDALQGAFGADLIYQRGYRKLGVLYSDEEYGVGFNEVLKEHFRGEVVGSEIFEDGSSDVRTQIIKIKNADADALYIVSNSPDSSIAALRQVRETGFDVAVFGSEGLKSHDILGAGVIAEGLIVTSVSAGSEEFIQKHKEMFGTEPGPFTAQSYDAFIAIAMAIKQGASTGKEIKDALHEIEFDGASGKINFDENGDVLGNYNAEQVTGGKFVGI